MKNIGLTSLIIGICVVGLLITRNSTQGQKINKESINDVPTLVKKGEVTEKEKSYSKEYKKLYPDQTEKMDNYVETALSMGASEEITKTLGVPLIPSLGKSPTRTEFIKDLTCEADAVVFGKVKSKTSHLTEDETWVYSAYQFSIAEIIKNNSISPIQIDNNIEITRPGGLIKLDNQIIRIKDRLYDQLESDNQYLLFLKFLPSVKGYMVSSARGDFVL